MKIELLAGERQPRESKRAVQACNDYLRMGPGRSLRELARLYNGDSMRNAAPTRSRHTLMGWSALYDWQKRSGVYDAQIEDEKNARIREILESGLALVHERVDELKALYDLLKHQLTQTDDDGNLENLWVHDVKQIGRGDEAERVDIFRYNAALIGDLRGLLDDLAAETGGRIQKTQNEHTGPGGGPIAITEVVVEHPAADDAEPVED